MLLIDKLWSFNISLSYPFHPPELGAAKKKTRRKIRCIKIRKTSTKSIRHYIHSFWTLLSESPGHHSHRHYSVPEILAIGKNRGPGQWGQEYKATSWQMNARPIFLRAPQNRVFFVVWEAMKVMAGFPED